MTEPVYARSPDAVWRLGPDRVLVRRIGGQGEDVAAELMGEAALVWVVLDEAGEFDEIERRIGGASGISRRDVEFLAEAQWISKNC